MPKTILGEIKEATERRLQYRIADAMKQPQLLNGIALDRIKKVLKKRIEGHKTLRSTVVGTQWTQERLYAIGKVDDPNCRWCQIELGTLVHRHCARKERYVSALDYRIAPQGRKPPM